MVRIKPAVCALLILLLASACARSPENRRDQHLARGKALVSKKDYARALVEFRTAMQAMPNDAEPYYQIGLTSLSLGDVHAAVIGLKKCLELNPNHKDARLKLAQLMAKASDQAIVQQAEDRLTELSRESAAPSSDVLNSLAFAELRLGKPGDAAVRLERVLATAPQDLAASILLAHAKLQQKDSKGAEAVLKKACEANPKSSDARVILGEFYSSQGRLSEAEAQFQQALSIDAGSGAALINLARVQLATKRIKDAEANLKRLSDLRDTQYQQTYGLFLYQQGRQDEAIREFERLASQNPGNRLIRTRLVSLYRTYKREADAERIVNEALKSNPKDVDALLQRGEMFISARKYKEAEADLNQVITLKRDSPEVHYVMGRLFQAQGATRRYRNELTEAVRLNPRMLPARLELVQALLLSKETQAASDVVAATPDDQKGLTSVVVQKNWVLWAGGQLAEMRKGIDSGLSQERSIDLLIQDGLWKLQAGSARTAISSLEEALKIDPTDLRALAALRAAYVSQKQPKLALEKINAIAAQHPKSASIQAFFGNSLLAAGEHQAARAAFTAAKAADPKSFDPELALANIDVREGKWNDAANRLKAILARDETNTTACLWLANVETLRRNYDSAIEHFRHSVDARPDDVSALNNLAYLLTEHRQSYEEALKYAQRAQELAPNEPAYADTLGWILYQKGLYPSAIQQLERAVSQSGGESPMSYHLAMAYAKAGNAARARQTFETASKRSPEAPEKAAAEEVVGSLK